MKNLFTILFLFAVAGVLAQTKPINITVDGKQVVAYKASYALVIGNSNYTNLLKLSGVLRDVNAVSATLKKNGFDVITKTDLTKEQIDAAFTEFIQIYRQDTANRLLFYFAGHGHTVTTTFGDEIGYFVPIDAPDPSVDEAAFMAKSLEMQQIDIYAKRISSKHALFLFDACFAGTIFETQMSVNSDILEYKIQKPVRQFITSGSAGEQVSDKSTFCEQFITAVTTDEADHNRDGFLTGTELGVFLQENVILNSNKRQHPQFGKIRNSKLNKGDFVFALKQKEPEYETPQIGEVTDVITYGSIELTTEIAGELYIDNKKIATIQANKKIPINKITSGTHTLEIRGTESFTETVTINADKTTTIIARAVKKSDPSKGSDFSKTTTTTNDQPTQFTDSRDGPVYKMVTIGKQTWMAENLAYKANSGCWAYDNKEENVAKYGYLYDWETAKNSCPNGWHLPSDEEWTILTDFLGGISVAGGELKSNTDWSSPNTGATNSKGFAALPGGYRNYSNGAFGSMTYYGYWWSSTANDASYAWYRYLDYNNANANRLNNGMRNGFSVRCVRD